MRDVRYGIRVLLRTPVFTLTAVVILSIAIGANTAVFSVVEGVLLRPLPYQDPERLCVLWKSVPRRNIERDWTSYPTIRDWQDQSHSFEEIAVVLRPEGSEMVLRTRAGLEKLQGSIVSGNFFRILGVVPQLGRTFSGTATAPGESVAVLSHGCWQRRFGASPTVLGSNLELNGRSVTVIGVMPETFQLPDKRAELWLPLSADPRWPQFQLPKFRIADAFFALGRLKPGTSVPEAAAEMDAIAARLAKQYPATDAELGVRVIPLFEQVAGARLRHAIWLLGAATLCVLLVACSNVAGLLLARGAGRRRELAVRAALGAGRTTLLRQLIIENLLLSAAGGIGGVLLAAGGLHFLLSVAPVDLPRAGTIAINSTVLWVNLGLCLLTGIVFGLLPASQLAGTGRLAALQQGAQRTSAGPAVSLMRGCLVAVQFALAVTLLAGAALLVRSFQLLDAVSHGFDTARLLTMTVELPYERYKEEARRRAFFDSALRAIQALPGVRGAAVGQSVFDTVRGDVPNQNVIVEVHPFSAGIERHVRAVVSERYFSLMGIPLLQGREFTSADRPDGQWVAVINAAMARHFWPGEGSVGKRFKEVLPGTDGPWITVIGVVGDVIQKLDGVAAPAFYLPVSQWAFSTGDLVIRAEGDPPALAPSIRQAVNAVDPTLPLFQVSGVDQRLRELDQPRQFQTWLSSAFAGIALLLAATGLYGLMAYSVTQRTKEFGIRLALGSTAAGLAGMVLRQAVVWALAGAAIGAPGALILGKSLSAWLYGVSPKDPATLAVVVVVLGVIAVMAAAFPAHSASGVEPIVALRHE